jgi:Fe-S cluster biogenesis protein NfuA
MLKEEKDKLLARIDAALDDVRPHLEADGGNVELLDLTDDLCVKIKWLGNCENCFMSVMTMKAGIEQAIKAKVPEVQSIEAINGMEMPL